MERGSRRRRPRRRAPDMRRAEETFRESLADDPGPQPDPGGGIFGGEELLADDAPDEVRPPRSGAAAPP